MQILEGEMRAYGLGRREHDDVDLAGIKENGRKSSLAHAPGPSGKARAGQRSDRKATARRRLKRRARAEGRAACRESLS